MPISVTFNGATFLKPGARSKTVVEQIAGQPLSTAGIVALVGEAANGAPGATDGVQEFASTELDALVEKYGSGPLVDCAIAALNPSRDSRIVNGASKLLVWKTNQSTQSTGAVQNIDDANAGAGDDLFDITSKSFGLPADQIHFQIAEGTVPDQQPQLTSGVITFPLTLTAPQTLVVNVNGTDFTYTQDAGDTGPHADVAALLPILNNDVRWAASRPVTFTAGAVANTIVATLRTDQAAFDGFERQHEYGVMHIKGTGVDLDTAFAATEAFLSNGLADGTFTVNDVANLAIGQFVRIDDGDSNEIEAVVTNITGAASPFTVEVDSGATDLTAFTTAQTAVVFTGGAVVDFVSGAATTGTWGPMRGARGNRIWTVVQNDTTEILDENANDVRLVLSYVGASQDCTLTINDSGGTKVLTTTTANPNTPAEDLSINLGGGLTIQQLVNQINNHVSGVYNCTTTFFNADTARADTVDVYSAIDIQRLPLNLKGALGEIETLVNATSQFLSIERQLSVFGQLEVISTFTFLSGAVNGASSNANFQTGFDALLARRANVVVGCVSRDASVDSGEGLTDSGSTYTLASLVAQVDSHVRTASNTTNRSERQGMVGMKSTFQAARDQSKILNSEFTHLAIQDVDIIDVTGTITTKPPHVLAALAAGMRVGGDIGEALTFKFANIQGISHADYNPKTQIELALGDGLLVVEQPDSGGFRFVLDNTTYQKDANFVFNRGNVFEAAQFVAFDLRQFLENLFVGGKVKSNNAGSIKSAAVQQLTKYRDEEVLVGDDQNGGLGFRDLSVTTVGSTTNVKVTITPVQANEFLLITLTLDTIRQAA